MKAEPKVLEHGAGAECPACGNRELFAHPDGLFRHCFSCGANIRSVGLVGVDEVMEDIFKASRQHLLENADVQKYLVEKRGLHPQVLLDSVMGVIPTDLDVTQLFLPKLEKAEAERTRVLTAPRKPGRPSKKEEEAVDNAIAAVERLNKRRDEFATFFEGRAGWLLFVYTDKAHRGVRIRLLSPESDECVEMPVDSMSGVFNHALFAPGQGARSLEHLQGRSIVVASEFDVLRLQSLGARLAQLEDLKPQAGYLKATAVGDGTVDAATVRALGQLPLVIRNGDNPGAAARTVDAIRQELNLHAVTVPNSRTLDEWLREQPSEVAARKALLDLAATQEFVARPYDAVQAEIDEWRSLEEREVKKFKADRWASDTLVRDITQRGQLFYDGREAYVLDGGSKEVFAVERDNVDAQLFLRQYGIRPTDGFLKHALGAIRAEAQGLREKTKVYSLSHYDAKTNQLYLYDQDRYVYRISKSRIERIDNGTDAVLFVRNPKWESFEIGVATSTGSTVAATLLNSVRLREEGLSRQDQELLFGSWVHALFFPELFPTRPLVAMIGEKGSAKTSVLRRLGQLLFGPQFDVTQLTKDPRDFDAAVTTDAFVVLDNADNNEPWLPDRLAIAATGGTVKRRRLYSTLDLVEYPVTAFLGVTSRTPHFIREDVADRLLIFLVDRMPKFTAEAILREQLAEERNVLMTKLVGELQGVLRALELNRSKRYDVSFRMADFGQFVLKVADADGKLAEAERMFERLGKEQLASTIEDDPIVELLEEWIKDYCGQEVSTGELFAALRTLASHSERSFDFKSSVAFGKYLSDNLATLKALFGTTFRKGGAGKRLWRFSSPTDAPVGVLEPVEGESKDDDDWMPVLMGWVERTRKLNDLN